MFEFQVKYDEERRSMFIKHATPESITVFLHEFPDWKNVYELVINGDYIPYITIPDGIESFSCPDCSLRQVYIPNTIKHLNLEKNKLAHIDLPPDIETVNLRKNLIQTINFRAPPKCLHYLELDYNRLKQLQFAPPPSLWCISIKHNLFLDHREITNELKPYIDHL